MKLIMMRGLPASGKSTKAQELMKEYGNFVRVNRDLLRTMLHFDKWTGLNERVTVAVQLEIVRMLLKGTTPAGQVNVIVDDTNLGREHHDRWKGIAVECAAQFEMIDMGTDWEECVRRDELRDKKVGQHVIVRFARQYRTGGYDMEQEEVICDIDGTLADLTHRLSYIQQEPKDWNGFFERVFEDTPREEIIQQLTDEWAKNKRLIMVSGRPERTRKWTEKWLRDKYIPFHVLFMRQDGDRRPDNLVKQDILKNYFNKDKVKLVIDDRPQVIRMWREHGLEVIDVGKGEEF